MFVKHCMCWVVVVTLAAALTSPVGAETDGFLRSTLRISPHVLLVYRPVATQAPFEGNSVVIEQSDGLVVVDAGGAPSAGRYIVEKIKAFSTKPVKFLAYTHFHGDHNLGAGAFLKAWPNLTIISTVATRADMTGPPMNYIRHYGSDYASTVEYGKKQIADPKTDESLRRGWQQFVDAGPSMISEYSDLRSYPATLTFTEKLVIPDSETPVELQFLGKANTDGDAVAWVPTERVLCSGDIVVSPIPYASASYPAEWVQVLKKLEGFDYAVLIPGHGEPQHDHAYLDKVAAALEEVQAQVTPLAKKGMPLDNVYKQTDFKKLMATFTGDDPWLNFLMDNVFLHSIIKNAYFEATGQQITQETS